MVNYLARAFFKMLVFYKPKRQLEPPAKLRQKGTFTAPNRIYNICPYSCKILVAKKILIFCYCRSSK